MEIQTSYKISQQARKERDKLVSANYSKLRGRIKEKFGNQDNFAAAMEMDRSTLSLKLNGKSDWTKQEMEKACIILDISLAQVYLYFFTV